MRAADKMDMLTLGIFLSGTIFCLTCSAVYHSVSCCSQAVAKKFNRLDYMGIVVLTVGSNIPALRFGLYCHPKEMAWYTVLIVSLGFLALYVLIKPQYATAKYRPVRAGLFIALGLCGIAPILHMLTLTRRFDFLFATLGFGYIAWSGFVYIFGAMLYVAHFPERFATGTFDYIGSSHQL
ncbi:hypothetical protein MVES1_000500 [Malassezia vespertilionis]|nr:uncharacterized protein MVES1_000500 [Malassezia vespertilionis]WFD05174.1 hypothetical protein MVES1_000500 [Malassezia vespertilionis]